MFDIILCVHETCEKREDCRRAYIYDKLLMNPTDDRFNVSMAPFDHEDECQNVMPLTSKEKENIDSYFNKNFRR